MDEKSKKIGAAVLVGVGVLAGVFLLITWLDLILTASTAEKTIEFAGDADLKHAAEFMKYSAIALIVCVFATAAAIIYGFFSKNKTLRKLILLTQALTIVVCIVFCVVASVYYGAESTKQATFVALLSFQTSLLRLIAACAVLLTATAVWYVSGFKKARLENASFQTEAEDAL